MHPKYRPDIDGLRALAVASVVIFHAFPTALLGGFIGVDIFFVISGFLITTIILQNQMAGTFSYRDFYARRIRRIFPALVLVLLATLVFGWYVLLSDEFAELGKQAAGGAAFVANFVFWGEAGYFDTAAEVKPLLHLWSLGIEEQFYIFWPLLLGLAWRRRWPIVRVLWVLAAASFLVNVATVHWHPAAAFYSPASRFWELMTGGILACMRLRPVEPGSTPNPSPWRSHLQSVLGVGLIVLGLVMIRSNKAFPGWWALLPTLGAVSCIAAGPAGVLNRYLLSNRLVVWIGLISYPLYLWHWPLLVYARILENGKPSAGLRAAAVAAAVLLAWATYRFVERFVRTRPSTGVLRTLAGSGVAIAAVGSLVLTGLLLPRNGSEELQRVANATQDGSFYNGFRMVDIGPEVVFRVGTGPGKVLLIGDSHVEQYGPRAEELARTRPGETATMYFATQGACASIPGMTTNANPGCETRRDAMLKFALDPQIDTVVIGGCWNCYFTGNFDLAYDFRDGSSLYRVNSGGPGIERSLDSLQKLLVELVKRKKKVYLLLDIPTGGDFEPKRLIEGNRLTSMRASTGTPTAPLPSDEAQLNERLRRVGAAAGVEVIDPILNLCPAGQCVRTMPGGAPAYKDGGHLRAAYTRHYATFMDRVFLGDGSGKPSAAP